MANVNSNNPLISTDVIQKNGQSITITTFHNCITALKQYENKSLEELRWEDYQLNKRYPPQPPPLLSTPQQPLIPNQTENSSNSSNDQRSTIKGSFQSKYKHSHGADIKTTTDNKSFIYFDTTYVSITAMHEYEHKPFEEIRFEDYLNGYKYPKSIEPNDAAKAPLIERKQIIINDNRDESIIDSVCPICLETIANVSEINYLKFFCHYILANVFFF
jgi:hypothetical protein